jgi:hypothetical protein
MTPAGIIAQSEQHFGRTLTEDELSIIRLMLGRCPMTPEWMVLCVSQAAGRAEIPWQDGHIEGCMAPRRPDPLSSLQAVRRLPQLCPAYFRMNYMKTLGGVVNKF